MARKHHHRGQVVRQESRADRLQRHADQLGRRSAREFGIVISMARMAELRRMIAGGMLPETIIRVGRVGASADAYAIDFNGAVLVAVYDRRGQSIASFLPIDAPEIIALNQVGDADVGDQNPVTEAAQA